MKFIALFFLIFSFIPCASSQEVNIDDLQKKIEEIGKLPFVTPVPIRYMKRGQIENYIREEWGKLYSDAMAEKEMEFAILMGFLDHPFPLKEIRMKMLSDNVGGLYNEIKKEMLIPDGIQTLDSFLALTLVHEFRHALQDQHFHLHRLLGDYSDFDDRRLAALAAIEGDATLIMMQYSGMEPDIILDAYQPESLFTLSSVPGVTTLLDAPPLLRFQMLMPYMEGLKFSRTIFQKKKWNGLSDVFRHIPVSTEQILHPDKYLKNELPVNIHTIYQPEAWKEYHKGVVGEFLLNVLLMKSDEPEDVAKGWGGDQFTIFAKANHRFLVWESSWDSEKDSIRFFNQFKTFLERKYRFEFSRGHEAKKMFLAGKATSGYFLLRRQGSHIFYARTDDRNEINKMINGGIYD